MVRLEGGAGVAKGEGGKNDSRLTRTERRQINIMSYVRKNARKGRESEGGRRRAR